MTLLESEYNDLIDDIYNRIEDQVDELTQDLDVDSSGSVLTITFPNSSQVILSRQVATHEIWVAAKSGGFHLHLTEGQWVCRTTAPSYRRPMGLPHNRGKLANAIKPDIHRATR